MTDPVWRKASRSSQGTSEQCVEVARFADGVGVRDSKDPHGPRLVMSRKSFRWLLAALKK